MTYVDQTTFGRHARPRRSLGTPLALLLVALAWFPCAAAAQETDAEAVAQELSNPNATLGSLSFPIDYIRYDGDLDGASDQAAWKLNFQPSLPYPLGERTNLFFRPLVPIVLSQPVPDGSGGPQPASFDDRGVALGNISYDVAIGHTLPGGVVVVGGVVGSIPTATEDGLGPDAWLLGPEAFLGYGAAWGFVGGLFSHQWDVGGGESSVNVTGGQYFYTFNLPNAWQIQGQPTWSYNHDAEEGQRLTLPPGGGVSKTTLLGTMLWKFALQYWYYVEKPDAFAPQHQIRFVVTPVVPLPWGG